MVDEEMDKEMDEEMDEEIDEGMGGWRVTWLDGSDGKRIGEQMDGG